MKHAKKREFYSSNQPIILMNKKLDRLIKYVNKLDIDIEIITHYVSNLTSEKPLKTKCVI